MIIRILLYTLGGLCLLAAVITAVGYALPQAHVVSREASLPAAPGEVFAAITDVSAQPSWRTGISKVEIVSQQPLTWREHDGSDAILYEVIGRRPPDLLRVRIADPELPFGGSWTYDLSPDGSGTRVRITEEGQVFNPVFRFMSRFVFGQTATIDRYLADLRRRFPANQ